MSEKSSTIFKALEHLDAGRLPQAEAVCRRMLASEPRSPHALRVLSNVLFLQSKRDQALHFGRLAIKAAPPGDAEFLASLGRVMRQIASPEETREIFTQAVTIDPLHASAAVGLVEALLWAERFADAADAAREALVRLPEVPELRMNLGVALESLGHPEEALQVVGPVAKAHPEFHLCSQFVASCANYVQEIDAAEVSAAHRQAGEAMERAWPPLPTSPAQPRSDKRLRVALLSPDLRRHAVCHFVEPIIRGLDRERFHVSCYMLSTEEDAVSARVKAAADAWHNVALLGSPALAQRIRDDRIDILIETSGYTAGHRQALMCIRPAPVQMTYCGYPNTTGLSRIDYRLVDSLTDPPGAERLATEKLLRLDPCFLCYQPPDDAPAPAPGPSQRGEPLTFGSFNALKKTSDWTIRVWGRMLAAVPGSRLVLKNVSLRSPSVRQDLMERLTRAGIDPARVQLLEATPTIQAHLAAYSQIDIALDTFPYHGTTTTCEALWMGVPVVTLAGDRHASRVGLSLLSAAGLTEFAAYNVEQWVESAARLARDPARLAGLRSSLRDSLQTSVLCNAPAIAGRFGEALERAWAMRTAAP